MAKPTPHTYQRIAADILIAALTSKSLPLPENATSADIAEEIAEAYRIIYRAVHRPGKAAS